MGTGNRTFLKKVVKSIPDGGGVCASHLRTMGVSFESMRNYRKVKRLFLLLAEDIGHWWFEKLDLGAIGLGSGCRVVEKGGVFNAKYNLIVRPWREI